MTIVIPCAGLGSRLREETKYINKAMVTVGQKPAFSYIFEQFSSDDEFVILLGYKGDELKCAIEACYPKYNIKFVKVNPYEGEGSGLGCSLSHAKSLLQKPFVFWACDTIFYDNIAPELTSGSNCIVTSDIVKSEVGMYRAVKEEKIFSGKYSFLDKDEVDPKDLNLVSAYTGVAYIKEYEKFWKLAENRNFIEGGEYVPLSKMKFACIQESHHRWFDIGNSKRLETARKVFSGDDSKIILPKHKEAIWFINGDVIKFHVDPKFIEKRVSRAGEILSIKMRRSGINVPEITRHNKYTYCYKEVKGTTLSSVLDPVKFEKLMTAFFYNAVVEEATSIWGRVRFSNKFYKDKTISRISEYLSKHKWYPAINGRICDTPLNNLQKLNLDNNLDKIVPTCNCHGDFHLENILYSEDGTFTVLDWRQGFIDEVDWGDQCYDLAKMLHSLIVNHRKVRTGKFTFEETSSRGCVLDIEQSEIYSQCRDILRSTCKYLGVDYEYIKMLTALVFLNIAACHDGDGVYPEFLFHLGAYLLDVYVEEHNG